MHRRPWAVALLGAATLVLTLLAPPSGASTASEETRVHVGSAGGTYVNVLGGAVRSDLTAGTYLSGEHYPDTASNTTVGVDVPGLVSTGAIETSGSATRTADGLQQTMTAETARLSLLDGLITADAVLTTTTAHRSGDLLDGGSTTRLVDLAIAGQHLPITVPANTKVTIPGLAEVTVNESVRAIESGNVRVTGSALKVRLLRMVDGSEPGTVVTINPTTAALLVPQPSDATPVGGFAHASSVRADVLGAKVKSDPTSYIAVPHSGTNGHTNVVSLARVTLPKLLEAGALETTATATSVPLTADVTHTAEAARVRLLDGLVTADAVRTIARVRKLADGTVLTEPRTQIVNLRLAGLPLALDLTKANRRIALPGVLSITANEQVRTTDGVTVTALHVTLLKPVGQLPAGADVKVGVASSWVG